MSIGANLTVIATGAILSFATHIHSSGFSVVAMGAVLIAVGVVGLCLQIAALRRRQEMTATEIVSPERAVLVRPPSEH
ncbi:hypothetical protein KGA66_07580 [Actinocrinis puniceicyclus]|uniref:Uncharacterized protein n=1 Tax=Actinocrinis puniceicyclus TaxID=977794 RepID=A0A8J7WKB6_9ACTN|nr:hypothetical protein [Actinocrinis puniceicyclus]MBS2962898.1 hypothetical protein [Actinocrinis puniceicyclus]